MAVAGTAAVLTVAWAGAAAAASIPLVSNGNGTAGYYGADDNHTHYRFVQTVVTATPQLVSLNGEGQPGRPGAVGAELCDPNIGDVAQISLAWNPNIGLIDPKTHMPVGGYQVKYAFGNFGNFSAPDPCIQTGFVKYAAFWNKGTVLSNFTINQNDRIYLGIYYNPNQANSHFQQISYGVCDITQGVCRQAWSASRYSLNFWEFGIGAFANSNIALTAPAFSPVTPFTNNEVTCYSCSGAIPISKVTPVNPFGIGGLTEAQFVNASSQVIMSPNNSLNAAGDFTVYNGSTSS